MATFTVCGVSTNDGEMKVRFANDVMRVKVLDKNGHTDILLIELPTPMEKDAAVAFIKDIPEFAGANAQAAIAEWIDKNTPKPKVERKPKAEKVVETKPAETVTETETPTEDEQVALNEELQAEIAGEQSELDDQPY